MTEPVRVLVSGAAAVLTVLVAGCTPIGPVCTEIGAPSGVAVTVESSIANGLGDLRLRVCVADACTDHRVELQPGSVTVGETCAGTDPSSVCSASAAPDGTSVGFVDIADLPAAALAISGSYRRAGATTSIPSTTVTAAPTHPNGPACPAGGNQVAVRLSPTGLR